ncbi:MAG: Phosphoglycolate phosphatase [Holosporales bacterium]
MNIRSFIFDWDNTLVNTWEMTQDIVNHVRTQFGLDAWTLDQIKASTHLSAKDAFPIWFKEKSQDALIVLKEYVISGQAAQFKKLSPVDGAHDLLIYLKEHNIPCAIFSNKQGERLRLEVNHMGWTDYFKGIYGSLDFPYDKPHPFGAQEIMKNHDFLPRHTAFVGDTDVDWQCARKSGCLSIKMGCQETNVNTASFRDCSDLLKYLQ